VINRRHSKINYIIDLSIRDDKIINASWRIIMSINKDEEEKIERSWCEWAWIHDQFWELFLESCSKEKNQLLKFDDNEKNVVKREDFDAKILICDDAEYAKDVHAMLVEMNSDLNSETSTRRESN